MRRQLHSLMFPKSYIDEASRKHNESVLGMSETFGMV